MRPTSEAGGSGVYECQDCGARPDDVEARVCGGCGGPLVNIGVERDL